MALRDEIREQRRSLKGRGPKAYLQYFMDYYRIPVLAAMAVIVLAASLLHAVLTRKEAAFGAFWVNVENLEGEPDRLLQDAFAASEGIDLTKQELLIEMDGRLGPGTERTGMESAVLMKLMTRSASRLLDVVVADAWNFKELSSEGFCLDLRTVLTQEELKRWEGRILYLDEALLRRQQEEAGDGTARSPEAEEEQAWQWERQDGFTLPDPAQMEEPVPVGIDITDAPWIREHRLYQQAECFFGFAAGMRHPELAKRCLLFLTGGEE